MSTVYSQEFQEKIVAKLLHPTGPSVLQLAEETGISKSTLYKWLSNFKQQPSNIKTKTDKMTEKPLNSPVAIRPQNWSALDKFKAITETASMSEKEIGAYCRQNGIYASNLEQWEKTIIEGLKPSVNKEQRIENVKLKAEIKMLKSELNRKEKALAEASALLILKKKAHLIWGDGKED